MSGPRNGKPKRFLASVDRIADELTKLEGVLEAARAELEELPNFEAQRHLEKAASAIEMAHDRLKRAVAAMTKHQEGG